MTDEQYNVLLEYKNFVTIKVHEITNPEAHIVLGINPNGVSHTDAKLMDEWSKKIDFQPEYSFGECIVDTIGSVMLEQQTGGVNYIT